VPRQRRIGLFLALRLEGHNFIGELALDGSVRGSRGAADGPLHAGGAVRAQGRRYRERHGDEINARRSGARRSRTL
jgi:hypothetical protein